MNATDLTKIRSIHVFAAHAAILVLLTAKLVAIQAFGRAPDPKLRFVVKVWTPPRGAILDRNGTLLAASTEQHWAILNARQVESPPHTAERISTYLGLSYKDVLERLHADLPRSKRPGYLILKKNVSDADVDLIRACQQHSRLTRQKPDPWAGLSFETFSRRQYPQGVLASQLIGLVSFNNLKEVGERIGLRPKLRTQSNRLETGQSGIESGADHYLSGKAGYIEAEADARGHRIHGGTERIQDAVSGQDVILTIDEPIQRIVEDSIRRCCETFHARYVTAIVMATRTGEILGMGTYPGFDPTRLPPAEPDHTVNWAASAAYEPGSTFKVVVASAAIELLPDWRRIHGYCGGTQRFGNRTVRCWIQSQKGHGHGTRDLATGIRDSCNLTMAEFGRRIGPRRLVDYMKRFGFGQKTGLDFLPEEQAGWIPPPDSMSAVTIAGLSFGQHFFTSPLTLLSAINTIANDGTMVRPQIVHHIRSSEGAIVKKYVPRVKTGIIRPTTAHIVRDMMVDVVENGTGKKAQIKGIRVAGKTGTAQKALGHRGYIRGKYVCSFVGFLPANDPILSILVVANEPDRASGGIVAAPTFKEIAEQSLARLQALPTTVASRPSSRLPIDSLTH